MHTLFNKNLSLGNVLCHPLRTYFLFALTIFGIERGRPFNSLVELIWILMTRTLFRSQLFVQRTDYVSITLPLTIHVVIL